MEILESPHQIRKILKLPRLINPQTNAQEEIEDALSEIIYNNRPGYLVIEGKVILGALVYEELENEVFSILHIGSQQKGIGRFLIEKLENLKPLKLVLSSRQDAFGFYQKLNFKKGERYGDFYKDL